MPSFTYSGDKKDEQRFTSMDVRFWVARVGRRHCHCLFLMEHMPFYCHIDIDPL